jgi:predicted glycogen debranching enzyme
MSNLAMPEVLELPRPDFTTQDAALAREWLVTNGLGGYAAGTVGLANTRRYHGLLVAALRPPVDRVVAVAKVDVSARYGGHDYALFTNEFADGTVDPHGYRNLARFALEGSVPTWRFELGDALLEQRIFMAHGANVTYLQLALVAAAAPVQLTLAPLVAWRDYHGHSRGERGIHLVAFAGERRAGGCRLRAEDGDVELTMRAAGAAFHAEPATWWRFHHRIEAQRGLDADEDLFHPGRFTATLEPGATLTLVLSMSTPAFVAKTPVAALPLEAALAVEQGRCAMLLQASANAGGRQAAPPAWIRRLVLAADQFIVARGAGERAGTTIIAGYPWFSDWGRDTMIALPGLTLATGRPAAAAAILATFAQHVSAGMLPNRFPDGGEAPEYNTVDATLWYFHAIGQYFEATADRALLAKLFPVLQDIIRWHERGTRHGIGVCARDGLLRAGEPGVQLTWMDAKVGDWVVTPRIGKPVEVNALWHYALVRMAVWATLLGAADDEAIYRAKAGNVAASFRRAFWNEERQCLHDVVDVPMGPESPAGYRVDSSLRPNQIFAVSLGADLLGPREAAAVVAAVGTHLLTPVGLRSLEPADAAYVPRYEGGPRERDAAYHEGTVWSWLLGPYALAHHAVHGDAEAALAALEGLAPHLAAAGLGQVSEIFDAEPPHAPRGCFAQAWSVGETLRAWLQIDSHRSQGAHR